MVNAKLRFLDDGHNGQLNENKNLVKKIRKKKASPIVWYVKPKTTQRMYFIISSYLQHKKASPFSMFGLTGHDPRKKLTPTF